MLALGTPTRYYRSWLSATSEPGIYTVSLYIVQDEYLLLNLLNSYPPALMQRKARLYTLSRQPSMVSDDVLDF